MNLEELISNYLDGELSTEQDKLLRERIAHDEIAREKFYNSVSLHIALKEDAESIVTPEELVRETEELIMMKILSDAPEQKEEKKRRALFFWQWNYRYNVGAVALLLVFIGLFQFSDFDGNSNYAERKKLELNQIADNAFAEEETRADAEKIEAPIILMQVPHEYNNEEKNTAILSSSYTKIEESSSIPSSGAFALTEIKQVEDNQEELFAFNENQDVDEEIEYLSEISNVEKNTIILSDNINSYSNSLYNQPKVSQELNLRNPFVGLHNLTQMLGGTTVYLSSTMGNDVLVNGLNRDETNTISQFAQSIAYSLSDNSRMGLEVGYSQYQYNEIRTVAVPVGAINQEGKGKHSGLLVLIPTNEQGNTINLDVNVTREKQIFWGTIFYENVFLNFEDYEVSARLGLGHSSDGPMAYSKLLGKYEFYNGIYIMLGAEARYFNAEFYTNTTAKSGFKSSISMISGLQFRL